MIKTEINLQWNYKNFVRNAEALKSTYQGVSASFSHLELHKKVEFMRQTKKNIYSLHFETWKKDKIWEYMNDFEDIRTLKKFV